MLKHQVSLCDINHNFVVSLVQDVMFGIMSAKLKFIVSCHDN